MTESFADILRHFGARVEIEHENALAQTRAFVQLIRRQESKEPWEETNFGAGGSAALAVYRTERTAAAGRR